MDEVRWHINKKGVSGRCRAKPGECPIDPDAPHYETAADARAAYDEERRDEAVAPVARKKQSSASARRSQKPMSAEDAASRRRVKPEASDLVMPGHGLVPGHGSRKLQERASLKPSADLGHGAVSGHGRRVADYFPTPSSPSIGGHGGRHGR